MLHFTTHQGLLGILDSRTLKSRARLNDDQRLEFILKENTARRQDTAWIDFVNLSISRINYSFLNASRRWHPQVSWRILSFNPDILMHDGVYFSTTNNIYPATRRNCGAEGLISLFADSVRGRYTEVTRRNPLTPRNCPTDIQAEVLYPAQLSTVHLRIIYVPDDEDQDSVAGQLHALRHPEVDVVIAPDLFGG